MEIKDLILLSEDDKQEIEGLPALFQNYMTAHSEFQIRNFILNDMDFPTIEGKYHQCVRELWARYQNLITLTYEYQVLQNEIETLEVEKEYAIRQTPKSFASLTYDLDKKMSELSINRKQIEINHKNLRLQSLQKSANETMREMKVFLDCVSTLDREIPAEFRDEEGRPDREKSETKFWLHKQLISEAFYNDPTKTPFNRLTGAMPGKMPNLYTDGLNRLVILPHKQLPEAENE